MVMLHIFTFYWGFFFILNCEFFAMIFKNVLEKWWQNLTIENPTYIQQPSYQFKINLEILPPLVLMITVTQNTICRYLLKFKCYLSLTMSELMKAPFLLKVNVEENRIRCKKIRFLQSKQTIFEQNFFIQLENIFPDT